MNPKREDVASPDATAAIERLVPPQIDGSQQALLHLHAPWKERADDELEVVVEIEPGRERSELLPARRIDGHRWELCSSPFLAENLALGDIVEADVSLIITRRVSRSGRAAISVFVADSSLVDGVKASLEAVGCTVERRTCSGSLAVDCADPETFDRAQAWLLAQGDLGFDVLQPPRRADDRDTAQRTNVARRDAQLLIIAGAAGRTQRDCRFRTLLCLQRRNPRLLFVHAPGARAVTVRPIAV